MPSYGVVNKLTINQFIADPRGPVVKIMRVLAEDTRRLAGVLAERDLGKIPGDAPRTGHLRRSFRVQKAGRPSTWNIRNLTSYFEPIELGAKPHAIKATGMSGRRAQRQKASLASRAQPKVSSGLKTTRRASGRSGPFLQFQARDGRWVKTKSVNHPGNRPYRILSRALYMTAQRNLVNVRRLGGGRILP